MTPGPVDLKIVGDRLGVVASCLDGLRRLPTSSLDEFRKDWRNAAAADSLLRRAIEALFDAARHLLAKGFGLGPLEYREVARLAGEKGLIKDPNLRSKLVLIAGFRNRLTHFYDEVTAEELFGVTRDDLEDLGTLAEELRQAASALASR
jgi:uncharacterized protein YutE (UPF0331/DUF86 family)